MTTSLRTILQIATGALAIAAGAQIAIPMVPVPTTLQTLALITVALLAGWRVGLGATALYLGLVLLDLPVLSEGGHHGGAAFLRFRSAGYVVGFLPGAAVAARMGHRRGVLKMILGGLVAHVVILALGVLVLAWWTDPITALDRGARPFLLGAVAKSVGAAGITWAWRVPAADPTG